MPVSAAISGQDGRWAHSQGLCHTIIRCVFGFDLLATVGHPRELPLGFPLLLFIPGNLGFFFGIRIIDQRQLRFLRRTCDKGHATCQ